VWERLATDLRPRHLQDMVTTVSLEELSPVFERLMQSQARGRTVVRLAGD
jgi:acrylyl-CoA reductase (NADPH)